MFDFIYNKILEGTWDVRKSNIWTSSSNIFQLVSLSGMDVLYISSMEKVSGSRPSGGMSLNGVLANRSASKNFDLGTYLILKALNELVMYLSKF